MISTRRFIGHSCLLTGLVAVALLGPGATSVVTANQADWLTVPAGTPLFDPAGIAPGDSGSATFAVTNPQSFPVEFSVTITGLANDDNGCNEPELEIGDTTCGAGGGELQSDLRVVLTATGATDRFIADDTLDAWAGRSAIDTRALDGHEYRTYRVDYVLPIGTSNVTQSDLVYFELELRLDQVLDAVASEPPEPVVIAATPSLPRTGTNAATMLLVALGAVLVGVGFVTISVRRRRST
jgi:LPXTG-motif cell wall-anchored protein